MNTVKTLLAGAALVASAAGANAATYATTVLSSTLGTCTAPAAHCTVNDRQNVNNAVDGDASTFYSLGLGGKLDVGFGGTVFGYDHAVKVTEITFSRKGTTPPLDKHFEAVDVFTLLGGVESFVGTLYNYGITSLVTSTAFDAIRLVDVTVREFGATTTSYDGFDVGSVGIAPVPLPAAGAMLLAGLGGFAALRRRKQAA